MSNDNGWYFVKDGETVGPVSKEQLVEDIKKIEGPETLVYGPGMTDWLEAKHISSLGFGKPHDPPPTRFSGPRSSDEIDYDLYGDDMQFVEITLDPNETVVAEAGGMMYMTNGIEMDTVLGDPSKKQGMVGKLASSFKRKLTGESLFFTTFKAVGHEREKVAFAAPYPGKIIPMSLDQFGGKIICQKDSFLCAAMGIRIGIEFRKKILTGFFGGEGFILQKLEGDGLAFIHAGGTIHRIELRPDESIRLDTGCLVAFTPGVEYEIKMNKGIKNSLFGGEGLFLANLQGPGTVWIQSLPFMNLASRILINARGGKGGGLGSILSALGD